MTSGAKLTLVYVLMVLYAVNHQMQSPLEPFLVERLSGEGADAHYAYGRLQSFFWVIQTLGSLGFGHIVDRAGTRVGFVINFLSCAFTYFVLSHATSIELLYLAKMGGLGMGGFMVAQTAVSHLTSPGEERVTALGRLSTAYSIGGVLGPYSGGLLGAGGDYYFSARVATAGALMSAVLSLFLPAGRTKKKEVPACELQESKADDRWCSRAKIVFKSVGFLIGVKVVATISDSMAYSSKSIVLKNDFGLTEVELGFVMSCMFAFYAVSHAFLGKITAALGSNVQTVVRNSIVITIAGFCSQAFLGMSSLREGLGSARTSVFVGNSIVVSLFQSCVGTSIIAACTEMVADDMKGTLMAIIHAALSSARIVAPATGVAVFANYGTSGLYVACSSIYGLILLMWITFGNNFFTPLARGTDQENLEMSNAS